MTFLCDAWEGMIVLILTEAGGDFKTLPFKVKKIHVVCDITHSCRWTLKFRRNNLPSSGQKHVSPNCCYPTTKVTIWLVRIRKSYIANGQHFTAVSLLKFPLFSS